MRGSRRRTAGRRRGATACTRRTGSSPSGVDRAAPLGRVVLLYLLFFADSGERAVVQALLAGSVTAVVAASLLVLLTLNKPYSQEIGGIRPVAMQRSLEIIADARAAFDLVDPVPCDAAGGRCEHLAGRTLDRGRMDRHDRSRSTRAGGGRDGVEQLPGEPVDG